MSKEVRLATIEESCEILDSKRKPIKKGDRIEGVYPYYGASGIADYINEYVFDGTYLLLSEDGDNLKTQKTPIAFLAKGKFWVNNHAHVLKGKNGNLTNYICYALQVADIKSYISGSTRPKITQSDMRKIQFNLPPLPEQKAIAHILGKLDDKIELNRKTNATLEAMAEALFKSWFVDFDPVLDNALAAGNDIPEALQAKAKKRQFVPDDKKLIHNNPKLAGLFPSTFVFNETLDKWIPEGWEVKKIKDVGKVITGKTPSSKTPEHFGNVYPFVTPTDFKNYFKIVIDSQRKLSLLGFENNKKRVLPKDSVLVTCIGSDMGKVVMNKVECMTNQQINSVVPKDDGVSGQYLYHFFNWNYELLRTLAFGGSTMPILNKSEFEGIDILVPDRLVASEVSRNFRESDEKVLFNLRQTEVLMKLRDTLLPQLISGKMRVPERMFEV